jgi:hypothetical protein
MKRTIILTVLLVSLAPVAAAQERTHVDLYRADGTREGYAIIDRKTGRVDYYDASSRRTGYGQVDATGRAERFDTQGRRAPETVLPPARRETR